MLCGVKNKDLKIPVFTIAFVIIFCEAMATIDLDVIYLFYFHIRITVWLSIKDKSLISRPSLIQRSWCLLQ